MDEERFRLEDEEMQLGGDAGHSLEDAVEPCGQQGAQRQRKQSSDADDERRFAQDVQNNAVARKPSARSAATSPSR